MTRYLLHSALALAAAIVLAGCASMQPLQSRPPMAAFSLPTPVMVRDGFANVFLPAGEYRAKFEDNRGFYYQAPEKIVGNNTGAWLWDGGLFIPKGAATPDRYYTIGRNNMVSLHRLGQTLEIQFSP